MGGSWPRPRRLIVGVFIQGGRGGERGAGWVCRGKSYQENHGGAASPLRGGAQLVHTLVQSVEEYAPTTLSPFGGLHVPHESPTQLLGTMFKAALVADILIFVGRLYPMNWSSSCFVYVQSKRPKASPSLKCLPPRALTQTLLTRVEV